MAQKAYVGINGISRNVKNIYIGVNGVAHKVVKGYIGVNGIAQQFWGSGSFPVSWDYWTSVTGVAFSIGNSDAEKNNNKIAYYAVFKKATNDYRVLFISPDSDATEFEFEDYVYMAASTPVYDVNNIGWYWAVSEPIENGSSRISQFEHLLIDDNIYSSTTQAVNALINKIYSVPFQHDFNVGQTYNMDITCSNMTFARKAIGIFLFKFISEYGTSVSYTALSNNVDTILNHFFNSNLVNFINLSIERIGGSADSIRLNSFFSTDTNPHTSYMISAAKDTISGFDYYFGRFDGFTYQGQYRRTDILSDGTITYSTSSASIAGFTLGVRIPDSSTYLLSSSNIGIDL